MMPTEPTGVTPISTVKSSIARRKGSNKSKGIALLVCSTLLLIRTADGRSLLVRETHAGERASRAPSDAVGLAWNDADAVALES